MSIERPCLNRRLIQTLLAATFLASMASEATLASGLGYAPGPAGLDYYSEQNILIGATQSLQSLANYGKGVTVGTIDTGIESSWVGFGGLTIGSYQCLNGTCGTANINSDNNGHGTFVASEIIGGAQYSNGNGMLGVAPLANLVSVKVLDANGSGYSNDVANGITYAVGKGAQVLNLSLGPSGTAAQQAAFYNSLAASVNAAAAKGAYIVFAGGNAAQAFSGGADITGFTNVALQHMLFVGATNSQDKLTSYSNTPGTGYFLSTTGQKYTYSSMWMMADGGGISGNSCVDCIVGAPNVPNANYLALDAGTSMAAPQGVGAITLLLAEWPILGKNGTAASVLEATGTNIGATTTYGDGFINLAKAFDPIGNLTITAKNGQSVVVSSSGSMLTSGALGDIASVKAILSNYTAFDSFSRNFNVNLSSLVANKSSTSQAAVTISAPQTSTSSAHFADGSSLAFGNIASDNPMIDHPSNNSSDNGWFMSFTDASGSTMAAGSGFPASASFAGALWGSDNPVAGTVASLGVSSALTDLAEGGTFVAFGNQLSGDTRMAFSWSETQPSTMTGTSLTQPNANSFSTGLTTNVMEDWQAGFTFGLLNEKDGLLGTTYTASGPLSLGDDNKSMSMGVSSVFALSDKSDLLVDAAIIRTSGSQLTNGIISDVSPLYARTFGAAFVERDTIKNGDNLTFSVRAPLRVYSGSADIATTSVDGNGNATTGSQRVSLTPSGTEMDFSVGYAAPVNDNMSWNVSVDARRDAGNISGENDADFLVGTKLVF